MLGGGNSYRRRVRKLSTQSADPFEEKEMAENRIIARNLATELNDTEIDMVAGGTADNTKVSTNTGPAGDTENRLDPREVSQFCELF